MTLIASLFLCLSVGFMFICAFLGKIGDRSAEGLAKYTTDLDLSKLSGTTKYIEGAFQDTMLPSFMITPYATVLPWVELITGVMLVIGLVTRTTFALVAATLASLMLGQIILGNPDKVIQIATYMSAAIGGIFIMHQVKSGGGKIVGVDDFFGGKVTLE